MRPIHLATACLTVFALGIYAEGDRPQVPHPQASPERKAELVKRFDKDGDGALSEAERQAAREAFASKVEARIAQFKTNHPKAFAHFDSNGDGSLDKAERETARRQLAERHPEADKNGNGTIDPGEARRGDDRREERAERRDDRPEARPEARPDRRVER